MRPRPEPFALMDRREVRLLVGATQVDASVFVVAG
jgi:hypothetical protein